MSFGIETDANPLFIALTADDTVTIPAIDLSGSEFTLPDSPAITQAITKLTNADLTSGACDGTGTFDVIMRGYSSLLKEEYAKNRISGAEYTKAFIATAQSGMQFAVQFLLGKDQAYWQAVQAQVAAIAARVQLETAKLQYAEAQLSVLNIKAQYALTKAKLATEDAQYGLIQKQFGLVEEQIEQTHAQTSDIKIDGVTPVAGLSGAQKLLYNQQVTSYKRDAEVKAAKIFTDAWTTMKTVDEAILPPSAFDNVSIEGILNSLKSLNGIGLVTTTDTVGE